MVKANFWFWVEVPGHHVAARWPWIRWLTLSFHLAQLLALAAAIAALCRAGLLRTWALWIGTLVYYAVFLSLMMPIPRYYTPTLPVMDTLIAAGLTLAFRGRPWARPAEGPAGLR